MRQCRLNFAEHRYDCEAGVIGEHNATELIITPPAIMPAEAVYRLCFEPGGLSEIILQTTDGVFSYPLPASVTSETYCCVTLIGYVGSEQIYKSRMVQLHFCRSAEGDTSIESQKPGIVDEINANTSARHTHTNKSVLDRLSDKDGKLQFDGNAIGGGGGASNIFYIDGTLTVDVSAEFGYDVSFASDVTYEQVDAACKAGKQLVVRGATGENITAYFRPVLSDNTSQPGYYFGLAYDNLNILMSIFRGDTWSASVITLSQIVSVNGKTNTNVVLTAEDINYDDYNTVYALISQYLEDFEAVGNALERLDEEAHTHDNKAVLDGITAADGKLKYNGTDVGLKGDKGDPGKDGADGSTGAAGADGVTPTIGENGNWYLGATDTGKPSRGEKGDQGIQGIQGIQGVKGEPGKDGTNGKDGASVTVKSVTESTADGGDNIVAFSDGKTLTVKNGSKGSDATVTTANVINAIGYTPAKPSDIPTKVSAFENDKGYLTEHQSLTAYAKKSDVPTALKSPYALTIKIGDTTVTYDGSAAKTVEIADGTEVSY